MTALTEIPAAGDLPAIEAFLRAERAKTLSETEWRFRMKGFGYALERTDLGVEVARLPRGEVLGTFAL